MSKKTIPIKTATKKTASKKPSAKAATKAKLVITPPVPRVDGEALADTARANRRKVATNEVATKPDAAKTGKSKPKASKDAAAADKANTGQRRKAKATVGGRKPSGLDLAAQALAASREPLNAKTIAERAVAAGWKTNGATPHATLYAAMIREIADKGKDARFKKTDRGMFIANAKRGD